MILIFVKNIKNFLAFSILIFSNNFLFAQNTQQYFTIIVVDENTGRGVPLVELKTTNSLIYYTDSKGVIAFYEPGLMNKKVYFHIFSDGYEYPKDGLSNRGVVLTPTSGRADTIRIKRNNIAERLYRTTGEGIYDESVKVGLPVPTKNPFSNGRVMGQDSYVEVLYKGKIYWFFGDTNKDSYPFGSFGASGATSELPGKGGLNPNEGVDLTYFVDSTGFSKGMFHLGDPGAVWINWAVNLKDNKGNEHLYVHFERIKNLGTAYERGMAVFNDSTQTFERIKPTDEWLNIPYAVSNPVRVQSGENEYFYFTGGFRLRRVPANTEYLFDPKKYESFTCLMPATKYDKTNAQVERTSDGKIVYGWKANTDEMNPKREAELEASGKMKSEERWWRQYDIESGKEIHASAGTIYWNNYVKRWVMIAQGSVGEVYYFEGDTPTGPWVYGRKIITHEKYNFYNVGQHPYFDQENGKIIYIEGTYTNFVSGNPVNTPRYDYNQIMYRLILDDKKLALPEPVYHVKDEKGLDNYYMRETIDSLHLWSKIIDIPFFAVPPSHNADSLIAIYANRTKRGTTLTLKPSYQIQKILFYALPAISNESAKKDAANASIVSLNEYQSVKGQRFYSTDSTAINSGMKQTNQNVFRVWRNQSSLLLLDYNVKPVPLKK